MSKLQAYEGKSVFVVSDYDSPHIMPVRPARYASFLLILCVVCCTWSAQGQSDTVRLTRDQVILYKNSVFIPISDTTILIPEGTKYQIKQNQYYLSEQFYKSMKSKTEKVKLLGNLYDFLISYRPPEDVFETRKPVNSVEEFVFFEGKVIKSIEIVHVDVGVGSVTDTSIHATSGLAKAINDVTTVTKRRILMNNILLREGDVLDPFRVSDSERLLRTLSYIEDARINVQIDPLAPEEVYLTIIVKDRFPWGISASFSSLKKWGAGVNNRNIAGLGDLASFSYLYSQKEMPHHGYELRYQSRNINRSFINFSAFLADNYRRRGWGAQVSRDFVSPQIKWGGQLSFGDIADFEDQVFADSVFFEDTDIRQRYFDTWVARALSVGERTNLSLAVRYRHSNYLRRPPVGVEFNERLHDRDLIITAFGINRLNFFKTKNIRAFNITEDAPVGFLAAAVYGRDIAEFEISNYWGGQAAGAMYNATGYYLLNVEAGVFVSTSSGEARNNVLEMRGTYFSPLMKWGRTYIRHFVRSSFFVSNDLSVPYSVALNENDLVRSINGRELRGNQLFSASLETVFFLPGYIYGFRFAPYTFADYGRIDETRIPNGYKNRYLGLGGGMRIRNESLVLDTFEVRFAYFPKTAPEGDRFRIKISTSAPVIFRAFNVNKPQLAVFE